MGEEQGQYRAQKTLVGPKKLQETTNNINDNDNYCQ